jgi:adenylyl-sulfate kinase
MDGGVLGRRRVASKSTDGRGVTVWFTGLPCSGKSTVAGELERRLRAKQYRVEIMDGDVVRTHLSKGLGFSKEDRDIHVRRIGFVCRLLSRNGVIAIGASISPYRSVRDEVRKMNEPDFIEVYTNAPLEECIRRDVKGMYKKALAGELKGFTGVDDPYEPPLNAEIVLETAKESLEQSARKVLDYLAKREYIEAGV